MKKAMPPTLRAALILLVMTSVCTLILASGNALYQGELAKRDVTLRMEILRTFGVSFTDATFDSVFGRTVKVEEPPREKAKIFRFQGPPRQAAVLLSGPGLWDVIRLLVFFDLDSGVIKSVRVISQAETPGLGSRIEENWFLDQFRDFSVDRPVRIVQQRTGASGEVDAITGATNTSKAVEAIINRASALAGK